MKNYYDVPMQVLFRETPDVCDDRSFKGGIAFQDYVICGECGATIALEDMETCIELPWVDISEEIGGIPLKELNKAIDE